MTDEGVLVAGSEPKPSLFARFKKQKKEKKAKKEKKPKKEKKSKKKQKQVADEDSIKDSAPSPLMSFFQTEKKKPRSEYQAEIDKLNEELKQTKEQLSLAQDRASVAQAKFERLKRWAASPPV